jgi:hypothetical protein
MVMMVMVRRSEADGRSERHGKTEQQYLFH